MHDRGIIMTLICSIKNEKETKLRNLRCTLSRRDESNAIGPFREDGGSKSEEICLVNPNVFSASRQMYVLREGGNLK